jgi:DNA-directed RNA polymerase, mitochondrial
MDLHQHELDLERLASLRGLRKAIEDDERAEKAGDGLSSRRLVRLITAAIPVIAQKIVERRATNTMPREIWRALVAVDAKTLALIGLDAAFTLCAQRTTPALAEWIRAAGKALAAEVWSVAEEAEVPEIWRNVLDSRTAKTARRNAKAKAGRSKKKEDALDKATEFKPWPASQMGAALSPILDALLEVKLFELVGDPSAGRGQPQLCLSFTDETRELYLEEAEKSRGAFVPSRLPMVVPPLAWTDKLTGGGYITEELQETSTFLASYDRGRNALVQRAMASGAAGSVVRAVNTLQSVPLRVNGDVLWAVRSMAGSDGKFKKLPTNDYPKVEAPADYEELSGDEQKMARLKLWEASQLKRSMQTDRIVLTGHIETAEMMSRYDRIFLPHRIDFRGRTYPVPTFSHHRADYVRGMFEFAESEPLGDYGWRDLKRHVASVAAGSAFGKTDKMDLLQREDWTWRHMMLIRKIGRGHEHLDILEQVDKPAQFYAACREIYRIETEAARLGTEPEYMTSGLPIPQDGTCSGLQHYAAIMRAEEEGRMVNLTGEYDRPQDVYAWVAEKVKARLENIARHPAGDDEITAAENRTLAWTWLDLGVNRSLVKRQVMTFPYSSETYGFAQQIMADTLQPLGRKVLLGELDRDPFQGFSHAKAAFFLARCIWASLQDGLHGASTALSWLKNTAETLARANAPLVWTVPTGLPILQRYTDWEADRVSLTLHGSTAKVSRSGPEAVEDGDQDDGPRRVRVNLRARPTKTLIRHKQVGGAGPNVIHSMDAAHLQLTTNAFSDAGGRNLLMIHDSFATTPGKTALLARVLREQFVGMYRDYCPLADIKARAEKLLGEGALEPLPEKGNLDLNAVLRSPYFFS